MFWTGLLHRPRPTAGQNPVQFLPVWLVREWLGIVLLGIYLLVAPVILRRVIFKRIFKGLSAGAYAVAILLLLLMALLPAKMGGLHWTVGLRYFIWLPELGTSL